MILQKDVPSSAVLERQQTVPGTMGGKLPLQRHMHQFAEILRQRIEMPPWKKTRGVTVRAATGSGKSILIPTEMQKYLGLRRHGSHKCRLELDSHTSVQNGEMNVKRHPCTEPGRCCNADLRHTMQSGEALSEGRGEGKLHLDNIAQVRFPLARVPRSCITHLTAGMQIAQLKASMSAMSG